MQYDSAVRKPRAVICAVRGSSDGDKQDEGEGYLVQGLGVIVPTTVHLVPMTIDDYLPCIDQSTSLPTYCNPILRPAASHLLTSSR